MNAAKYCGIFVLLFFVVFFEQTKANDPSLNSCGNWKAYKDELCYKIIDDSLRTFDEAKENCAKIADDDNPSMVLIKSKEEQDFLNDYLFTTEKKVENFWIGAKYDSNKFHWIDSSDFGYTNWLKAAKNKSDYCVQMQAEEDWFRKWLDEPCTKKNLEVCQKKQWTQAHFIKNLDEAQHQQKSALDEANKKIQAQQESINEANIVIEEANQKITQQKHQIEEANQKIIEHKHQIEQANDKFAKQKTNINEAFKKNINLSPSNACGIQEIVHVSLNESTCSSGVCTIHTRQPYKLLHDVNISHRHSPPPPLYLLHGRQLTYFAL